MKKTIDRIGDFEIIIDEFNNISEIFSNKGFDDDLLNRILLISEPIINAAILDDSLKKEYSTYCVDLCDEYNRDKKIEINKFNDFVMEAKIVLAVLFIRITLNNYNNGKLYEDMDDTSNECFLNFWSEGHKLIDCARYFAIRRFSYTDPMRSYNETIKLFERNPTFFNEMIGQSKFEYDINHKDVFHNKCLICGSESVKPYFCAEQSSLYENMSDINMYSPAKLWLKCSKCDNLSVYNFPQKSFEVLYNGDEYDSNVNSKVIHEKVKNCKTEIKFQLSIFSDILNKIRQYNSGLDYLEIGLGSGEMISVALEMGYNVSAIDISEYCAREVSSMLDIDVNICDFMKFNSDKQFDVIIMGDVIEHISNPVAALEKAHHLLKSSGVIWLSTPNYESSFSFYNKYCDPMWREKTHYTYFSYRGIKPILERIGFEVKKYDISHRYNGSMELILQKA